MSTPTTNFLSNDRDKRAKKISLNLTTITVPRWHNVNLYDSIFNDVTIKDSLFDQVSFSNSIFRGCKWNNNRFTRMCDMSTLNISNTEFRNSNHSLMFWVKCNIQNSKFVNVKTYDNRFEQCNVQETTFENGNNERWLSKNTQWTNCKWGSCNFGVLNVDYSSKFRGCSFNNCTAEKFDPSMNIWTRMKMKLWHGIEVPLF